MIPRTALYADVRGAGGAVRPAATRRRKKGKTGRVRPRRAGDGGASPRTCTWRPMTIVSTSPQVTPGHEVVVMERNGPWVSVFANTDTKDEQDEADKPEFSDDENVTPESGWMQRQGRGQARDAERRCDPVWRGGELGGRRPRSRTRRRTRREAGAPAVSAGWRSTSRTRRWRLRRRAARRTCAGRSTSADISSLPSRARSRRRTCGRRSTKAR